MAILDVDHFIRIDERGFERRIELPPGSTVIHRGRGVQIMIGPVA